MRTQDFDEGYEKGYDDGREDEMFLHNNTEDFIKDLLDYIKSNYDVDDNNIVKDIYTRLSKII